MQEFDYIVIGAGSAGCVVANRLSADPGNRVLALEAGPKDSNPWIHVPVGYYRTMYDERISWGYETEPVPEADGRRIGWPRGKVLGGCSSINGLVYMRGQREDFDHWRQLGNAGWAYDDVLPYFRRAENQPRGQSEWHGIDGPLGVSEVPRDELCEAYISACTEAGITRNDDFNGSEQEGAGYFQLTAWKGRRNSTARAYLKPARGRANLRIETEAMTLGLIVEQGQAAGVRYQQGGQVHEARARGEVIVCAGAINSPQLLQLSGIGPGELLNAHGIEVRHALPGVGANLQDHYQSRCVYECTRPITVNDQVRNPLQQLRAGLQWLVFRTGPMTVSAGQVGVFAKTRPELASPDVQFHFIRFSSDKPGEGLHPFSGFTASVCQLRPESRGTVQIQSSEPHAKPLMQPNYLATQTDRETMTAGLQLARRIARQPSMAPLIAREVYPGPEYASDEDLLRYVRATGTTIFHPSGTCKMGADPMAVVDERLRVHGIGRLRVADASIMPTVVSGNTNAGCIMIGEKCADMVLADARGAAAA